MNFSAFDTFREDSSVRAPLTRLSKLTTSGVQIPPINAVAANSTYTLEVMGPSLKCDTPSTSVLTNIDAIFEETGGSVQTDKANNKSQQMAVYVAFTPFTPVTYYGRVWPLDDLGQSESNGSSWSDFVSLCVKGSKPGCSLIAPTRLGIPDGSTMGYGKTIDTKNALWLRLDEQRLSCSVQQTRFKLYFDARNPLTALKHYTFEQQGTFESDTPERAGFITAVQPLLDILRGSTYFNSRWCYMAEMQMSKCTTLLQYATSETSIHETALTAMVYEKAAGIANKTWDIAKGLGQGVASPSNDAVPYVDPLDVTLTRNLSLSEIIEEMSRNLTLSYFSDARYLSAEGTFAVTITVPINVYHYNARNLMLTYAIAFGASALAVVVGLYVFVTNGCTNCTTSFSAILCATIRNRGLGDLIEQSGITQDANYSPASMVAGPDVLKMRLKYGTLLDDHSSDVERREAGERMLKKVEAFGLPGQVL